MRVTAGLIAALTFTAAGLLAPHVGIFSAVERPLWHESGGVFCSMGGCQGGQIVYPPENWGGPAVDSIYDPGPDLDADLTKVTVVANDGTNTGTLDPSATTAQQPVYATSGGRRYILWDGETDRSTLASSIADWSSVYTTGVFELDILFRANRIKPNVSVDQRLLNQSTGGSDGAGFDIQVQDTGGLVFRMYGNAGATVLNATLTDTVTPGVWYLLEARGDGTDFTGTLGTTTDTVGMVTANLGGVSSFNAGVMSRRDGLASWVQGGLAMLAMSTSALTAGERSAIRARAAAFTGTELWLALGDSTTLGDDTNGVELPYPLRLEVLAGKPVANHGISGGTVSAIDTRYGIVDGQGNVTRSIFVGGVNDLIASTSAATIWTTLEGTVDAAITNGDAVVLGTVMPWEGYSGSTAAKQTEHATLNTSIRAKAGVTLVDLYEAMRANTSTRRLATYFDSGDGLHPNDAGAEFIAARVNDAINGTPQPTHACGDAPASPEFLFWGADPVGNGWAPPSSLTMTDNANLGTDTATSDHWDNVQAVWDTGEFQTFDGVNDRTYINAATSNYPWVKGSNCGGCGFYHGVVFRRGASDTGFSQIYGGTIGGSNMTMYMNAGVLNAATLQAGTDPCSFASIDTVATGATWHSWSFGYDPAATNDCMTTYDGTLTDAAEAAAPDATDPTNLLSVGAASNGNWPLAGDVAVAASWKDTTAGERTSIETWLECVRDAL